MRAAGQVARRVGNAVASAYSHPQGPFGMPMPQTARRTGGAPGGRAAVATQASGSAKKGGGASGGVYLGPVKKGKRLSRKLDKFLTKGFSNTHEITGDVTDTDCCYIAVGAIAGYKTIELLCQALLRTLFQRAGLAITGIDQVLVNDITGALGTVTGSSAIGWRLNLKLRDVTTNVDTWLFYDTTNAETIQSITGTLTPVAFAATVPANWPDLISAFRDYSAGGGVASTINVREPIFLALQCKDLNPGGTDSWRTVAQLNLRDMYVHCRSKAVIKVQNRSKGASGSGETTAVDTNPVRFVKYVFNGNPRPRAIGSIFPQANATTGVITAYGHLLTSDLLEPPMPKFFWNCYRRVADHLNPGIMKSDAVTYYVKKPLLKFLQQLRTSVNAAGNAEQNLNCKYALYAFEDLLNFNAAQKISIAYEVNRFQSIYVAPGRVKFATSSFGQSAQSSEQP